MRFFLFSVFLITSFGFGNGLKCYNATAMPDFPSLFMQLMFSQLGGNDTMPSIMKMEANPSLPFDADLIDGCNSCMRMRMRGIMEGGSEMTAGMFGATKLQISFVVWGCNTEKDGKGGFFGGMGKIMDMMPGANESFGAAASKANETECIPVTMNMKLPFIKGAAKVCMCCEDRCNQETDCGITMDDFEDEKPLPTTPAPVTLATPSNAAMADRKVTLKDKCAALNTAVDYIRDVCGYIQRQPDTDNL